MMRIAYHASHEQFAPSALRHLAAEAERAGFDAIASSDHLAPWDARNDVCGAAWTWIPTVLSATRLPVSVVTTAGWRYPPLVLAQSIATIGEMFPGRLAVTLGSGEALNEAIVARDWPGKDERNRLLQEHVHAIDEWLRGRTSPDGSRLWLTPDVAPPLSVAAVTRETAAWVGTWWDWLATIGDTPRAARERVEAFRRVRGEHGHVTLKVQICVAPSEEAAIDEAMREWRTVLLDPAELAELRTPEDFERAAASISREHVRERIAPVTSADALGELVEEYARLDPDVIILHDVGRAQDVIRLAQTGVLDEVRTARASR